MARKGYRQRKSGNNNGNHDVLGITLVVISLFVLLCIAIPPILSIVSRAVFNIMLGVFGIFSYPLCIIVFLLGVFILTKRTFVMSKKAFVCTLLISVFALIILHLASTHAFLRQRYVDYIADVYTAKYSVGGVILGTLAFGLKTVLTEIGCYIIFSFAILITVVVMTDLIARIRARKASVAPAPVVKPKSGFDVKGEPQRVVSVETAPGLFVGTIERSAPPIQTETGVASEIPVREKRNVTDYAENPVIERDIPRFDGDDRPLSEARFTLYGDSDVINKQEIEEFGKQVTEVEPPVDVSARFDQASAAQSDYVSTQDASASSSAVVEPYERVNADARAVQPKKIVHTNSGISEGRSDKPEIYFPIEKKSDLNDEGIENIDDIKARLQKAAKERKHSDFESVQTVRTATETRGASFVVPEYGAPPEPAEQIIIPSNAQPQTQQPIVQPQAESVEDRFLRAVRQETIRVEPPRTEPEPDIADDIVDAYAMRTMDPPEVEESHEPDVNPDDIIDGTHSSEINTVNVEPSRNIFVENSDDDIVDGTRGPSLVISDEPAIDLTETHDVTSDIIDGGDTTGMYVSADSTPAPKPVKRQKNNGPIENQISIDGMLKEKAEGSVVLMQTKRRKKYNYMPPPIDLLKIYEKNEFTEDELNANAQILESVVGGFLKTQVKVIAIVPGPQVTRYEIEVPSGVPVKSIEARSADIAYELAAVSGIRVEAPIPGKRAIGIEVPVPDSRRSTVGLREIIDSAAFAKAKSPMTFAVGKDLSGGLVLCDLEKVPHLLMAGQTGSGKSAGLNGLIISLLYKSSPDDLRFILVDPKRVEFSKYRGMPHLLFEKIVTEPTEALNSLKWACNEMERRYTILQKYSCSKISEYNAMPDVTSGAIEKLPHIVIIIDELANLMQSQVANDIESKISSIAALARAAGIHLIVATQRPSADVITGTIKVNLSSRIAFKVGSQIDSRIILESNGAEALSGQGDMLFYPVDASSARRVQGSYVGGDEVVSVISYLKEHFECDFDEDAEKFVCGGGGDSELGGGQGGVGNNADPLLPRILALAINSKMISVSVVQRRFSIGYARAARIIDYMEEMGYVGPNTGNNKGRDVLLTREQYIEKFGDDVDDN